ncbi:MAG: hypothetical protein K2O42_04215 [Oscillospiraceae bacterium]|nr:hypothetical protein [Oscillospiraceae bacterium]MDE7121347.1 hypothetical protein [Oscillospiraceae bacterium]
MSITVLLVGIAFIAFRIWWCIGITVNGQTLCQGKMVMIDPDTDQLTIEYTYKKEKFFHTFSYKSFPLGVKKQGVKVPVFVEKDNPENITKVVQGYYDYGALSRLALLFGCIFTLAGLVSLL